MSDFYEQQIGDLNDQIAELERANTKINLDWLKNSSAMQKDLETAVKALEFFGEDASYWHYEGEHHRKRKAVSRMVPLARQALKKIRGVL